MSDLVQRLLQRVEYRYAGHGNVEESPDQLCQEAAARIQELETQFAIYDKERTIMANNYIAMEEQLNEVEGARASLEAQIVDMHEERKERRW